MKWQQAKITVLIKVVESHGLPRNKEKQNGRETPRWCPTKTTLWSERQKAETAEKPSPQNGTSADNHAVWKTKMVDNPCLGQHSPGKTGRQELYEAVLVADGVCWHCLGAPTPCCQLPCFLLVTLCTRVWGQCGCSLSPPSTCCTQPVLVLLSWVAVPWKKTTKEDREEAEPSSIKEWRPGCYSDVPEATSSGAQRETKKASVLHHPSFPTRMKEKGNRASAWVLLTLRRPWYLLTSCLGVIYDSLIPDSLLYVQNCCCICFMVQKWFLYL